MFENLRSDIAQIIYDTDGEQTRPDGTVLSLNELFETPLEDLDIDSLSILEIIMEIELRFDVELTEVDPDTYLKISDLEADLIKIAKDQRKTA